MHTRNSVESSLSDYYSSILECDLGTPFNQLHKDITSTDNPIPQGTLLPVGNFNSNSSFLLYTGNNLNRPILQGKQLNLVPQIVASGIEFSEPYPAAMYRVNSIKTWFRKPCATPKKMILGGKTSMQYNCTSDYNSDLFQVGIQGRRNIVVLDFRLVRDKTTNSTFIYGGKFGKSGYLLADSHGLENDALTESGVLLWKPTNFDENGVPSAGEWVEISVLGRAYSLRTASKKPGKQILEFPGTAPTNQLLDYSIIYCQGICFLWRLNARSKTLPKNIQKICCPVTLDIIPTHGISSSIGKPRSRLFHQIIGQGKDFDHSLVTRPWFFSGCGHVFSFFPNDKEQEFSNCCICRTPGHLVPLTSPNATLNPTTKTFAFDTCGHIIDYKQQHLWTSVVKIPRQCHNNSPKLDFDVIQASDLISFYHACLYCAEPVRVARKLFFTVLN